MDNMALAFIHHLVSFSSFFFDFLCLSSCSSPFFFGNKENYLFAARPNKRIWLANGTEGMGGARGTVVATFLKKESLPSDPLFFEESMIEGGRHKLPNLRLLKPFLECLVSWNEGYSFFTKYFQRFKITILRYFYHRKYLSGRCIQYRNGVVQRIRRYHKSCCLWE